MRNIAQISSQIAHYSTRLVWHDRGWDGRLCDHPRGNSSCIALRHIREAPRDDDFEEANAGQWLGKLEGRLPPCARDPNVFSDQPFTITHFDPIDGRNLAPITEEAHPYRYFRNQVDENLELAYALTVHKSQGSDFDCVFLVLPSAATTLSREILYTGLTQFRKKIVLLLERDARILESLRNPAASDTLMR